MKTLKFIVDKIKDLYNENILSEYDKSDLRAIAEKIQEDNVILFLGAAVHCPPPVWPQEN